MTERASCPQVPEWSRIHASAAPLQSRQRGRSEVMRLQEDAMHVVIVGGGIGGLTLALMLQKRRIGCDIYEASPRIRELGVGINVLPHAIAELSELCLLPRLDAVAVRTRELIYANRFGQEIWREPRGLDAGYKVPQFSIHRGHLQGALRDAVVERLGRKAIHTGHVFTAFAQEEGAVKAR